MTTKKLKFILLSIFGTVVHLSAQTTETDGDWKQQYVRLTQTIEADLMIRYGDIDNLGFGWGDSNPFNGGQTPVHSYPWKRDINDSMGFDMVMTTSTGPILADGYSSERENLIKSYGRSSFAFKFPTKIKSDFQVNSILLQLFVDDIETLNKGLHYRVYVNKKRALFMEEIIGKLNQSGPIGRLVNFYVPQDFLSEFTKPEVTLQMDDSSSGRCDGFAIDFIKILYNPKKIASGHIKFIVKDVLTKKEFPNALVTIPLKNQTYKTNQEGEVIVQSLPVGYTPVIATFGQYRRETVCIDVISDRLEYVTIYMQFTDIANVPAEDIPIEKKNCECQTNGNSDSTKSLASTMRYQTQNSETTYDVVIQKERRYILLKILLFVLDVATSGSGSGSSSSSVGSSSSSSESSSRSSGSGGSTRRR